MKNYVRQTRVSRKIRWEESIK